MALSLELSGILWWNFAYTLILTRCTTCDCQMRFEIGWVFTEIQILKKGDYHKMTLIIGRGFAERQILKKWKWPYLLNWVEYFERLLRKHWYWQDLAQEIAKCHFSSVEVCRAPNSEKAKMTQSLELSGILWLNFAYTLVLTRCSPWDCQMTFGIGRDFAEVQILKKSET